MSTDSTIDADASDILHLDRGSRGDEDASDVMLLDRAALTGGRWVTIHPHGDEGSYRRLYISGDGMVKAGPKALVGKHISKLGEKHEVRETSHPQSPIHHDGEKKEAHDGAQDKAYVAIPAAKPEVSQTPSQTEKPAETPRTVADAMKESPRAAAAAKQKQADADYLNARASAVPNAGEDLKGSARHKSYERKSLAQAEADGTAEKYVTRDHLMRVEPHDIGDRLTTGNALTALAMHHAMQAFPGKPGRAYTQVGETAEGNRQKYHAAYQKMKALTSEALSLHPSRPDDAIKHVASGLRAHIGELQRGGRQTETFDSTAHELRKTYNLIASNGSRTHSVVAKLAEFAGKVKEKYGALNAEHAEHIIDHVRDVIGGSSLNEAFGTKSDRAGPVQVDVYSKDAQRTGGREIPATPAEQTSLLKSTMGMRGVQYGNSVPDAERAHHLKKTAEAFVDMADATGLDDQHMSLNGRLGIAIGARGRGGAKAHYEPSDEVINLTRASGAGSLAHEWGHALDHALQGGKEGNTSAGAPFMSEYAPRRTLRMDAKGGIARDANGLPQYDAPQLTPVQAAMAGVRTAMQSSGFNDRLAKTVNVLDRKRALAKDANYWHSPTEKFARVFERHVQDKLRATGRDNTYLTGFDKGAAKGDPADPKHHDLWPNAAETAHIAPAMDTLMSAVREHHFKAGKKPATSLSREDRAAAMVAAGMLGSPVDMGGALIYLSSDAAMQPAVTLGQGYPAVFNGQPIAYQWIDSAVAGNWRHPRTGQAVPIDDKRIDGWVKNIKLARERGVDLPAVKDHKETADASMGAIFDARRKDGRLQLLAGFYGDDMLAIAKRNKVSVGIDPNFQDSHGNKYGESIRHLAFTPVPVIHDLRGFIAASRGEPTEADFLTLAPTQEGVEMIDPALMSRVAHHLGDDTADDANEALAKALDKLDAQHTQLSAAKDEPALTDADTRVANYAYRTFRAEIESLVNDRANPISRHGADVLLSVVESEKGKPNVLLLSRDESDGAGITPDRLLEVVRALRPGLSKGEKTGAQIDGDSLLLSRGVPDEEKKPDVQAEVKATLAQTATGRRALAAADAK